MHKLFALPQFYFETPGASGAAVAVQPGQSAEAAPTPGQGDNGNFWSLFPNVPEEQKPLIEPHIREMQGHVTRLEQSLAPFKPFIDAGYQAQDVQGLLQFSQGFDQDPLGMWLQLGDLLQGGDNPVLDPEIDLEHLAALARGENPDEAGVEPGAAPVEPGNPLEAEVVQLREAVAQLTAEREQEKVRQQTSIQDQLYTRRMSWASDQLKQAGFPAELVDGEDGQRRITARVIQANGNMEAAVKAMVDERTAMLKGFVEKPRDQELDLPNGVPSAPRESARDQGDPWARGRKSAAARLRRENSAAAQ